MGRDRPELASLFDEDGPEPFFVKNLENVQGDERDVMVFSVGYGKDGNGTMTLNFGPLNQEGGARRLNVAITRARRSVKVVSSIRSSDIQVGQNGPMGVVLLRDYLDHAESKGGRVAMTPHEIELSRSMLEGSIAAALTARGHQVVRNVGTSSIRVDVAVMDPSKKGSYLLGVLCDGTSYTTGRNARDREIVRESVLKNLGWNTVRVWSRDWALDRERTLDRIEEAVRAAIKRNADK
jgi:predicted dehydrogenase